MASILMKFDRRHRSTIISILVIAGLSTISFYIAKSGDDFASKMIVFVTIYTAIIVGILFVITRYANILKTSNWFLYNYFGVLNLFLGIVQLIFTSNKNFETINNITAVLNVSLGIIILIDIYRRRPTAL